MRTSSDPNTWAVYRTEEQFWRAHRLLPVQDSSFGYLQRMANAILRTDVWRAIRPDDHVQTVTVQGGRLRTRANAKRFLDDRAGLLSFAPGTRNVPYLLHELGHLAQRGVGSHGPLFVDAYCLLVASFYGAKLGEDLRRRMERAGCV